MEKSFDSMIAKFENAPGEFVDSLDAEGEWVLMNKILYNIRTALGFAQDYAVLAEKYASYETTYADKDDMYPYIRSLRDFLYATEAFVERFEMAYCFDSHHENAKPDVWPIPCKFGKGMIFETGRKTDDQASD